MAFAPSSYGEKESFGALLPSVNAGDLLRTGAGAGVNAFAATMDPNTTPAPTVRATVLLKISGSLGSWLMAAEFLWIRLDHYLA